MHGKTRTLLWSLHPWCTEQIQEVGHTYLRLLTHTAGLQMFWVVQVISQQQPDVWCPLPFQMFFSELCCLTEAQGQFQHHPQSCSEQYLCNIEEWASLQCCVVSFVEQFSKPPCMKPGSLLDFADGHDQTDPNVLSSLQLPAAWNKQHLCWQALDDSWKYRLRKLDFIEPSPRTL